MSMLDFTQGNPWKLLLQFAIPLFMSNLLMQLYHIVDIYVVGNYIGPDALAAVGSSMPVLFALVSFIIGITMAGTIIVSQYLGARDMVHVRKTIDTIIVFVVFAALLITVLGWLLCDPLLRLVKTPANVFDNARVFLQISLAGTLPLFGINCLNAILRGVGDSKTPLYCMIISSVMNVFLAVTFVAVMDWGIAGAAWATVSAQFITVILAVIWINRKHPLIHIAIHRFSFDFNIFRNNIRIGLPNGIQQALVAVGMMALLGVVNRFCTENSDILVAYSVVNRIDSLATAPAMTFSIAIAAFVGQNVGAGKQGRIAQGLRATLIMSSIASVILSVLFIMFRAGIMEWFATDAEPGVIAIGSRYLTIVGAFYITFSLMFVINGVMRGAGDTLVPMFITLFSLWLVRIPIASVLSRYIGPDGIWWAIPIAWSLGAIAAYLYYRSGKWRNRGVVQPVEPVEHPIDIPAQV